MGGGKEEKKKKGAARDYLNGRKRGIEHRINTSPSFLRTSENLPGGRGGKAFTFFLFFSPLSLLESTTPIIYSYIHIRLQVKRGRGRRRRRSGVSSERGKRRKIRVL